MRNSILTIVFFTILFSLLSFSTAYAGSVSQVKGSKVLIQLNGDSAQVGQEFYVLDSNDKRIALMKITQVKGEKALAEITKGSAVVGGTIKPKTSGTEPSSSVSNKRNKISGGVLAGYAMNSMALTAQHPTTSSIKESLTLADSSFSLKAFADYDLSRTWTIRASTGYETFSAKGTTAVAICSNGSSKNCTVGFDYLSLEGSAHYNFMTGNTRGWVGLGYAFLLELAKKVDVPNLNSSGGQNQMILFSGGADFGLSGGKFIPVVVEYGMFPGSSSVTASAIYIRSGYGFNF